MRRNPSLHALLLCAFLWAGCEGTGPWSFDGTVDGVENPATQAPLRAAVAWTGVDVTGSRRVTQEVLVEPRFPAGFRLSLDRPPEGAFAAHRYDLRVRKEPLDVATGLLVVYEDVNANGALDLVESPDGPAVDRVVGPADTWLVVFLDELPPPGETVWAPDASYGPAPPDGWEIPAENLAPGLSLLLVSRPNVFVRGQPTPVTVADPGVPVTLRLGDARDLAAWTCSWRVRTASADDAEDLGAVAPEDVPWDAPRLHVDCAADGRSLRFHARLDPVQPSPCARIVEAERTGTSTLDDDAAPPPHWPCLI